MHGVLRRRRVGYSEQRREKAGQRQRRVQVASSTSVSAETLATLRRLRLQPPHFTGRTWQVHRRSRRDRVSCSSSRASTWRSRHTGDHSKEKFELCLTLSSRLPRSLADHVTVTLAHRARQLRQTIVIISNVEISLLYTTENVLPNDNVSMSVGHVDHVLIVYSSMEHVTWKSSGPVCG